ncbi:MAG TPA: hypothetical protein VKZ53_08375 [Candidatus Angelobacter sp.]|nr:hypothetical protein [Candidatus Angelobacter sp.]
MSVRNMSCRGFLALLIFISLIVALSPAQQQAAPKQTEPQQNGGDFSSNPNPKKLPTGVILVKGAVPSASDKVTPLPEDGVVSSGSFTNKYFGLSYSFSSDWIERFKGPPPSDSGYYVLAQLRPSSASQGAVRGSVLIAAQDLFFGPAPASDAMELIKFTSDKLQPDYKVERAPAEVKIAGRPFVRFDYMSPVAGLHWYFLATEIRCHAVEFILTSQNTELLESMIKGMDAIKLPPEASATSGTGGGAAPVCIKDYATNNVVRKVEPILGERRYSSIPVRVIIGKEGKVKHIHFINAFPDQAKVITDALMQWTFKPYLRNGQPAEVETGLMFGLIPAPPVKRPVPGSTAKPATNVAN